MSEGYQQQLKMLELQTQVDDLQNQLEKLKNQRVREETLVKQKFVDQRRLFDSQCDDLVQQHERLVSELRLQLKSQQKELATQKQQNTENQIKSENKINAIDQENKELKQQIKIIEKLSENKQRFAKTELTESQSTLSKQIQNIKQTHDIEMQELQCQLSEMQAQDKNIQIIQEQQEQIGKISQIMDLQQNQIQHLNAQIETMKDRHIQQTKDSLKQVEEAKDLIKSTRPQVFRIQLLENKLQKQEKENKKLNESLYESKKDQQIKDGKIEQLRVNQDIMKKSQNLGDSLRLSQAIQTKEANVPNQKFSLSFKK